MSTMLYASLTQMCKLTSPHPLTMKKLSLRKIQESLSKKLVKEVYLMGKVFELTKKLEIQTIERLQLL